MKLFGVRFMDDVPGWVRETCDRYTEQVIGTMLAGGFNPSTPDLKALYASAKALLQTRDWLTERTDIQEYRERWIQLRDLILDLVIIGLIGWEICEGRDQAAILERMDKSTANTATAMQNVSSSSQAQATNLKALADEQLEAIKQMRSMVAAMQEQLNILKEQQSERRLIASKKPQLRLMPVSGTALCYWKRFGTAENSAYCDLTVENIGRAQANNVVLKLGVSNDQAEVNLESPPNVETRLPVGTYEAQTVFTFLRPRDPKLVRVIVKWFGADGCTLNFSYSADEVPESTSVGSLRLDAKQIP